MGIIEQGWALGIDVMVSCGRADQETIAVLLDQVAEGAHPGALEWPRTVVVSGPWGRGVSGKRWALRDREARGRIMVPHSTGIGKLAVQALQVVNEAKAKRWA